jgi:predicted nucleic acid-binding protein
MKVAFPDGAGAIPSGAVASSTDVVLDTNVVLGWLLFHDPRCATIGSAITERRVRWLIDEPLRAELAHVLGRGIAGWPLDAERILSACGSLSIGVEGEASTQLPMNMRCTDPDDQKFIDFALANRVSALLTHDRAVLKLARRAAALGLWIGPPERWSPTVAG